MVKKRDDDKPRCVKCNSSQVYIKQRKNIKFCRTCGHEEELKEVKK
jgi:rRNA maturation endonuclease Nob1|tara:strand:+ start:1696 stop:1833 length:138 start_codon:yes stop_codon:yes gene_type:complete